MPVQEYHFWGGLPWEADVLNLQVLKQNSNLPRLIGFRDDASKWNIRERSYRGTESYQPNVAHYRVSVSIYSLGL